ncbi:MAG TPA: hypothetical protein VHJ34_00410 [Actinomycetota bacterium]|nr:hypothetical protein [Actinomycetota bacterium]
MPTDRLTIAGSSVPLVAADMTSATSTGLAVPPGAMPTPDDYLGTYVDLSVYAPELAEMYRKNINAVVEAALRRHSRSELITRLALLNRLIARKDEAQAIADGYVDSLEPQCASRLRSALRDPTMRYVILGRQQLLATMRHLFIALSVSNPMSDDAVPPDVQAILLAHAVGTTLAASEDDSETLGNVPTYIVMEIVRLGLLYQHDDMYSAIDRHDRLWLEYGARVERVRLRAAPQQLVMEATGLDLEDILALGFALVATAMAWRPDRPPYLAESFGAVDDAVRERFFRLVADTEEGFNRRFRERLAPFDYLPFQQTPVLRGGNGLLVLDIDFLWDRITTGLYWLVHDHEKSAHGERARDQWTHAYAEMIEKSVVDQLITLAPPLLGTEERAFYSEDDIGRAFNGKRCDAAIDVGHAIVLYEIVSGQLSTATRIEGSVAAFHSDTERLVLKKCRQLDAVARDILKDERPLTSARRVDLRVIPVVVVGGGYPVHSFTVEYIRDQLRRERCLIHASIEDVCVIDLRELEMLEGLAEQGHDVGVLLREWKHSSLATVFLRNFLIQRFGPHGVPRPRRMATRVRSRLERVADRLGVANRQPPSTSVS